MGVTCVILFEEKTRTCYYSLIKDNILITFNMKVAIALILTLCIMGLHAMPSHLSNMEKMRALSKLVKIAQEKKTAHKLENALRAYKTTAKKFKLQTKDDDYVPESEEEIQRCGDDGYATAYGAALELLQESTEFNPADCPDPEDGIWMEALTTLSLQPYFLCDLEPEDLLFGFECVKHYVISHQGGHPIALIYEHFVEPISEMIPPY